VAWGGTEILVFLAESLLGESVAADVRRYLAILLIAGFPAAMYLAWARDLGYRARRIFGASVLAVVIVGGLLWMIEPPVPPLGESSIAILPFDVCDERISDKTLALGLTAAVHGRLAERQGLSVVGRPTMKTVLDTSPSLTTVARLLGVNYLLSGILCRDGRDPVLQAELLDGHGKVIWRQEFRETVNDFNQVGEQLAELVDNGVAARFGDRSAGISRPAVDREALRQLQLGYGFLEQENPEKAREAFEKALEIEPEYPSALYALSLTVAGHFIEGSRKASLEETAGILRKALERARADVKFNPRDFEANKIAGFITHGLAEDENEIAYMDYQKLGEAGVLEKRKKARDGFLEAQRYLDAALAIRPDDSEVRAWVAHNLAFQSPADRREAMEVLKAGVEMDPFNVQLASSLAVRLVEFGDVNGAMDLLDSFSVLPQGKRGLWVGQLEILNNLGRIDEKLAYHIEHLKGEPGVMPGAEFGHLAWNASHFAIFGLHEEAAELYEVLSRTPFEEGGWFRQYFLHDLYSLQTGGGGEYGERELDEVAGLSNAEILERSFLKAAGYASLFFGTGEMERGIELMEALVFYPHQTVWKEREMNLSLSLAHMYDAVGNMDGKKKVLERVVAYLDEEVVAGVRHPGTLSLLAGAYAGLGDRDAALAALDLAIDYGFADTVFCCRDFLSEAQKEAFFTDEDNNWWEDFEGDPDFELAMIRMRSMLDARRANIRALLQQNDIGELLVPWVEFYERALAAAN
jgi:TolB-like protein